LGICQVYGVVAMLRTVKASILEHREQVKRDMGTAWHSVSKMGNGLRRISSYFKRIQRTTLPTLKVCSDTGHDSFRDGGINGTDRHYDGAAHSSADD
jgi:hypothetical protein